MEFWLNFLPIIIYILLIVTLIIGIIIGVKIVKTMNKVEIIVDDVNQKISTLNGLFNVIENISDKITLISDKVVNFITDLFAKLLFKKGKKEYREEDENE